jgi:hypothetical protein
MLIPVSRISGEDFFSTSLIRLKISSKSKKQLANFLACCESSVSTVSVVELPFEIKSDKYFMAFDDVYLGCFSLNHKKNDLVRRAELNVELVRNKQLMGQWIAEYSTNVGVIKNSNLPQQEKENLLLQHQAFIDSKYSDIAHELAKYPKILHRNF